jgi:TatD DNase family protein
MFIDSHAHLDRVDLSPYGGDFGRFVADTNAAGVDEMLCISIDLDAYPAMEQLVQGRAGIWLSVGVHPNEVNRRTPTPDELVQLAQHPQNIAIGETGLDYHYNEGDLGWQHERFRNHIRAARLCNKPLIIHSRDAKDDTIRLLKEEGAAEVGGVMHCFTETWDMAKAALDLGFYISFSGILTFKTAEALRQVAAQVPSDRLLIETDCPYLAPIPHRGKASEPRHVALVAKTLAGVRNESVEQIAHITSTNFRRLFFHA